LYLTVRPATSLQDGKGGRASLAARLKEIARRESIYRARSGFCSLDFDHIEQRELYAFKMSLLKKYVSKPLYLDVTMSRPKRTGIQHAVGAVAAAFAAAWAVIAQTFLAQGPGSAGGVSVSAVTSLLFAAGILAYVLKDRIKVFINETVMRRLRVRLPDRD